jgi:hypothetical protein
MTVIMARMWHFDWTGPPIWVKSNRLTIALCQAGQWLALARQ